MDALNQAIKKLGGVQSTADKFGLTTQAIYQWIYRKRVPLQHCLTLEEMTGIPFREFRPDLKK